MFDWWNNLWTRLRAPTARRPLPLLRGRYDAAVTSDANVPAAVELEPVAIAKSAAKMTICRVTGWCPSMA